MSTTREDRERAARIQWGEACCLADWVKEWIETGEALGAAWLDRIADECAAHREAAVKAERERIEREMLRETEEHRVTVDCDTGCIPEGPYVMAEDALRIVRGEAKGGERT